jgi:predicted nucleic acid-binding protein
VRVVFDTNVLLSAIFTRGLCEALLGACVDRADWEIVVSDYKFRVPVVAVRAAVDLLRRNAEMVMPAEMSADACEDKDDLPVLGTAVAGGADLLVTGDAELLALGSVRGIPIVSPRALYERLR